METKKRYLLALLVPAAACAALALIFWNVLGTLSPNDILHYMPANAWAALAVLCGLYALKGLSVFFPVLVLQVAAGIMFGPVKGFFANMLGLVVAVTLPYLLGRFMGPQWQQMMVLRIPKLRKVEDYRCDNALMFSYILRALGFLPYDIISWYLGSTRVPYWEAVCGSLAGTLTGTLIATLFGDTLANGFTWGIVALWAALTAVSYSITYFLNRRMRARAEKKEGQAAQREG